MPDERVSGIYQIEFRGKAYVGSSVNVHDRWRCHRKHLNAGTHHSPTLQRAFIKHEGEGLFFSILEEVEDHEQLIIREQHWLDSIKPFGKGGYNTSPKAGSCLGIKRSDEYRAAASAARKGKRFMSDEAYAAAAQKRRGHKQSPETSEKKSISIRAAIALRPGWGKWLIGVPKSKESVEKMRVALAGKRRPKRSLETRLKQSMALRGKKRSPETLARMSAAMLGKKRGALSPETREKISAAHVGRKFSQEHRDRISKAKLGKKREVMACGKFRYV